MIELIKNNKFEGEKYGIPVLPYDKVVERAKHRIKSYNFESTVQRFSKLVELIKSDKVQNFPEYIWNNDILVEKDPQ